MQPAARLDDGSSHGGTIVSGSGTVFINSKPAAIGNVSVVTCALLHGAASITCGSGTVFINQQPAARIGDSTGCGAEITSGSGDVFIG
ncbi:Zn-binding Pro-Ala-Ala-Arg (PAAR) domain-containing protein, incolved in TypeVI secretion [Izhakiella capsodis]|uniref:Zn-binding Pro-Ala-Ala-Arg (PAAR) domain-containing protein, incolved in TypeVI secretion n=1 Tax=Izhakiella capsodis TaxID=1367852 RepID=A0A1I5AS88_9GAMM|nr:PAAR domain-containing protein [Izhakiella capsodis]SFN65315.1 Zn-binding Pro-Ala-Ala-Arg (PAAR) domain-containing protein, incolved in TypeVI secretion [Izhakiella capsodis]